MKQNKDTLDELSKGCTMGMDAFSLVTINGYRYKTCIVVRYKPLVFLINLLSLKYLQANCKYRLGIGD